MAWHRPVAGSPVVRKLILYGDLVMFRHTLFALPFALIGVLFAAGGMPSPRQLFWVLTAMVGARNGANAFNRFADRQIDAANPRTASRHLPQKLIAEWEVLALAGAGFLLFSVSAYMLNPLCFALLPIPLVIMLVYSYTKRFTWLCHLVLGAAVGGAPMGGWLAIKGAIRFPEIFIPGILWAAVALWVAGFDIIYGTQDLEFDRTHGIYSIPAAFGIPLALKIAAAFHFVSVLLLFSLKWFLPLGWVYILGVAVTAGLLWYEHRIVSPTNLTNVTIASYNVNEIVAPVMLLFTFLDIVVF